MNGTRRLIRARWLWRLTVLGTAFGGGIGPGYPPSN